MCPTRLSVCSLCARHGSKLFTGSVSLDFHNKPMREGIFIIPIFQVRKLRQRAWLCVPGPGAPRVKPVCWVGTEGKRREESHPIYNSQLSQKLVWSQIDPGSHL